jgi:hypothetical protein
MSIPQDHNSHVLHIAPCRGKAASVKQIRHNFPRDLFFQEISVTPSPLEELDERVPGDRVPASKVGEGFHIHTVVHDGFRRTYGYAVAAEVAVFLIGKNFCFPVFFAETTQTDRKTKPTLLTFIPLNRNPIHISLLLFWVFDLLYNMVLQRYLSRSTRRHGEGDVDQNNHFSKKIKWWKQKLQR